MSSKSGDKKNLILRTAMQLFAVKGASATSMQEIAESCGMSKGSLYLQFKSKEELESSVFDYCFELLQDHLLQVERQLELSPREKLCNQFEVLLNLVVELREFLMMQIKDWITNGDPNRKHDYIMKHNAQLLRFSREKLISVYSSDISPYIADILMLAHGMITSYAHLLFNPQISIETSRLAHHLVDVIDVVAARFLQDCPKPLISEETLSGLGQEQPCNVQPKRHPLQVLKELKTLSESLIVDPLEKKQAIESLEILEDEIIALRPRQVIINGMLGNLSAFSSLEDYLLELRVLLQPYLNTH
ncbi:TetR/AcrR family transcriptional regulator [Paenibacillus segetis]|uniref:TetR family transcriptional regulator n=1 Tax=Paenibacillus segetis TaxID=1325360 RepID=A0ABQ1YQ25_9BACL|nr:TetR/AcrR family transcriptional regulator [Paenibacillus segetis]GGH32594.1 TetR family transcriptional regulator [Paenibacillus segetis]